MALLCIGQMLKLLSLKNPISIFLDAPVCKYGGTETVLRAALGEEINVPCAVNAHPTNVSFQWTLSNTITQVSLINSQICGE